MANYEYGSQMQGPSMANPAKPKNKVAQLAKEQYGGRNTLNALSILGSNFADRWRDTEGEDYNRFQSENVKNIDRQSAIDLSRQSDAANVSASQTYGMADKLGNQTNALSSASSANAGNAGNASLAAGEMSKDNAYSNIAASATQARMQGLAAAGDSYASKQGTVEQLTENRLKGDRWERQALGMVGDVPYATNEARKLSNEYDQTKVENLYARIDGSTPGLIPDPNSVPMQNAQGPEVKPIVADPTNSGTLGLMSQDPLGFIMGKNKNPAPLGGGSWDAFNQKGKQGPLSLMRPPEAQQPTAPQAHKYASLANKDPFGFYNSAKQYANKFNPANRR